MWAIFKVFIDFATILCLFCVLFCFVLFFGYKACEILAPGPGIEPTSPALEGEVLTTKLPGKSLCCFTLILHIYESCLQETVSLSYWEHGP